MEEEIWKDIKNYEGIYQVSNLGRIKSLKFGKERVLKSGVDSHGYLIVVLCNNGNVKTRMVHQLVAEAFLDHKSKEMKYVVNHKNFIRTDNRIDNLEIITQKENSNKKHIKSSSKYIGVLWNSKANKWQSYIYFNKKQKHLGLFKSEFEAHLAYEKALSEII